MWSPQPHVWQPATGLLALLLSAGCADPGGQGAPGTLSEDTPEETPVPELVDSPPAAPPVEQATLPPYPVVLAHGLWRLVRR